MAECGLRCCRRLRVRQSKLAQRQLQRERASQLQSARLLSAIIDSSDDAIRKRLDGTVETCNAGAERLFGYPAAVAIRKHISLVSPPERIDQEEWIIATLKAGRRIDHFETERARADGTAIRVSLTISPIVDDTGAVVAASRILRDVSARKDAEAERQRLLKVLEDSPDVIGICDLLLPALQDQCGTLDGVQGSDAHGCASSLNVPKRADDPA